MNKLRSKITDDLSYSATYGLEYVVQQEVNVTSIGENVMSTKTAIEAPLGINVRLWFFNAVGRSTRNCHIQVPRLKLTN